MLDEITEGIPDRLKSWTLRTYGLIAVLMTVVLSVMASILTIFEIYGAARVFATATIIGSALSAVLLAIWTIFIQDEDI